eukprot:443969-Amphidinium_carterae.1
MKRDVTATGRSSWTSILSDVSSVSNWEKVGVTLLPRSQNPLHFSNMHSRGGGPRSEQHLSGVCVTRSPRPYSCLSSRFK